MTAIALAFALLCVVLLGPTPAQSTDAAGESQVEAAPEMTGGAGETPPQPPLEIHGFVQYNAALRPFRSGGYEAEWLKAETRAQLDLSRSSPELELRAKLDLLADPVTDEHTVDLREAYVNYYGRNLDLRIGKQIVTWGVGDLLFLTDVFPKDWTAFLTGAPVEYLKAGATAVRANYAVRGVDIEALVVPKFEPDNFPSPPRLAAFDPFPAAAARQRVLPGSALSDREVGLRVSRMLRDYSTSFYAFGGWDPRPSFAYDPATNTGTVSNRRLRMVGASTQGPVGKNLLSAEVAYYRTEDTAGTDPGTENPSVRTLVALERVLKDQRTVSAQLYQEWALKHGAYERTLPPGSRARDAVLSALTLRFRDSLRGDTVKPTVFAYYNFSEADYFVQAEVRRRLAEGAWWTVGLNVFGGRHGDSLFGQFNPNDNLYATVRYAF